MAATPTTESVQDEIQDIHDYVDQIPVVEETLRKAPRVIGVVGTEIETFHECMRDRFEKDGAAHVDPRWEEADKKFLALLTIKETKQERIAGETVELTTRPINKEEIQNIDQSLRESDEIHATGLTQELYEDLSGFRVRQR